MRISTPFLFFVACVCLYGEDPKLGSTREEVVKLLGEPNGRIELKNGGSIFSFSRGIVTFDKTKAVKVDLVSERQADEARAIEKAQRDAAALTNAPGGEAYRERKRQELRSLVSQFNSSKIPGQRTTHYIHKDFACFNYNDSPEGPRGLTVAVEVSSDGGLALYARYIGFQGSEFNQLGASLAKDDFMSPTSKDVSVAPDEINNYRHVMTCVFRDPESESFIRRIHSSPGASVVFTTFKNRRPVGPNIHPGSLANCPTSYTLTEKDKRAIRKAVELSECLKALEGQGVDQGASR